MGSGYAARAGTYAACFLPGVLLSLLALLDAAWKAALPGRARLGVGEDAHHAGVVRISSLRRFSLLVLFLTHREAHCLTPCGFSAFAAVSP